MNTNIIFRMDLLNITTIFIGMILLVHFDTVLSWTAMIVLGAGYFAAYIFGKKNLYYSSTNKQLIKKLCNSNLDRSIK